MTYDTVKEDLQQQIEGNTKYPGHKQVTAHYNSGYKLIVTHCNSGCKLITAH